MKTELKQAYIARTEAERYAASRLRHEVFAVEQGRGTSGGEDGLDRDRFDDHCEHLIVPHPDRADTVIGTYRILLSDVAEAGPGYYSETEFDMSGIRALPIRKAEIGRSCVHPDFRDGSVIRLLWSGLVRFMQESDVGCFMGCGSLTGQDVELAEITYACFRDAGRVISGNAVRPVPEAALPGFRTDIRPDDAKAAMRRMPPLMKGYLRAGACIAGPPACDQVFGSIDFFLIFFPASGNSEYKKHFGLT